MKYSKEHVAQAFEYLRKILKPGDTVYTVGVHPDGNQHLVLAAIIADPSHPATPNAASTHATIRDITPSVATVLGARTSKGGAIVQGGCGYSKGFHLVYSLGSVLWPEGTPEPHGTRNGKPDTSGGYALRHESI